MKCILKGCPKCSVLSKIRPTQKHSVMSFQDMKDKEKTLKASKGEKTLDSAGRIDHPPPPPPKRLQSCQKHRQRSQASKAYTIRPESGNLGPGGTQEGWKHLEGQGRQP